TSSSPTTRPTPVALDWCRATVELHAELDEEGDGSFEVVDHDTDMGHPLDRHFADPMRSDRCCNELSRCSGPNGGNWRYSRTWGGTADQSYVSVTVVRDGPVASRS